LSVKADSILDTETEVITAKRILVIEDNVDSRDLLVKLLRQCGYEVASACDSEGGFIEANLQIPDLIVTDVNMPGTDGIEFVKTVKANPTLSEIPIIVTTAYGSSVAYEAKKAGADAAIDKPFDFDEFLETITVLLAKRPIN
jgi:two-component system cell cycle response regulator DivK